jgi:hypothetical protein
MVPFNATWPFLALSQVLQVVSKVTKFPIARTHETLPSILLVHTEKASGTSPHESVNLGLAVQTAWWRLVSDS